MADAKRSQNSQVKAPCRACSEAVDPGNWTKVDKPSIAKATQIVAFLSEIILSESVRTGFYRIQTDFDSALRDQKVAGSNLVTSTTKVGRFAIAYQLFLMQYR